MARARTIKPQFLRSDSMRRVSRDAQLTFIKLWLAADDAGRLSVGVHGLGYRLYPGDEDAQKRVAEWLAELEREHCIEWYVVDRLNYLRIVNWRRHQKIYHPTPSRLPARPPGPASGAPHEALGSDGEKPAAGKALAAVVGISRAPREPHDSLGKEGDEPSRRGLLGRFHERFMRQTIFSSARESLNALSRGPLNAPSRGPLNAPSRGDAPRDRQP